MKPISGSKGSASILLMLILLCLTSLGVLAVVASWSELKLSRKNADFVQSYYHLDSLGEEALAKAAPQLDRAYSDSASEAQFAVKAEAALSQEGWRLDEKGLATLLLSAERGDKTLYLEVSILPLYSEGKKYEIRSWRQWQQGFDYTSGEGEGIRIS